jgi:hypothetical protein
MFSFRNHIPALALVLVASCARTSMTSLPAPDLGGRSFRTILVVGHFADLKLRQETEARFVSMNGGPVRFIASTSVLFPGREFTQDEIASILKTNNVDATLVISPEDAGSRTGYVPPTYTSGCTLVTSNGCQQVTTTTRGGYAYSKPWAQFTAQLYDVQTGKVVWYASSNTRGNAYANSTILVRSMADKTIERLVEDGLIR